jgi:virginiamycin B lyase
VVSARKDAATITVSVVPDQEGKYTFPAGRLEPGQYQLSIRAGGYELESPRTSTYRRLSPRRPR